MLLLLGALLSLYLSLEEEGDMYPTTPEEVVRYMIMGLVICIVWPILIPIGVPLFIGFWWVNRKMDNASRKG